MHWGKVALVTNLNLTSGWKIWFKIIHFLNSLCDLCHGHIWENSCLRPKLFICSKLAISSRLVAPKMATGSATTRGELPPSKPSCFYSSVTEPSGGCSLSQVSYSQRQRALRTGDQPIKGLTQTLWQPRAFTASFQSLINLTSMSRTLEQPERSQNGRTCELNTGTSAHLPEVVSPVCLDLFYSIRFVFDPLSWRCRSEQIFQRLKQWRWTFLQSSWLCRCKQPSKAGWIGHVVENRYDD